MRQLLASHIIKIKFSDGSITYQTIISSQYNYEKRLEEYIKKETDRDSVKKIEVLHTSACDIYAPHLII